MSLFLTAPLTEPEMDALIAQAETLLCYAHPEVEVMAFRLARAVRQLRAEKAEIRKDLGDLLVLIPEEVRNDILYKLIGPMSELDEDARPSSSLLH